MTAPWLLALYALWMAWGAIWLAAWLWANRTTGAASGSTQAPYRIVNMIGWVALFADRAFRVHDGHLSAHPFLPPLWQLSAPFGWALVALALAGMAFSIWSRLVLGKLWSVAVTRKEGHRVVDTGPYGIVRHPIYTGILTGAFALAAAKGTPIALGGFVLMLIGYHMKARVEERFLAAELGEAAYAGYRARVPMLLPLGPVERMR